MNLKKKIRTKIYTKNNNKQSRFAVLELENYGIPFSEQRLDIVGIKKEEVVFLSKHTEGGIMDLLATQSMNFKKIKNNILDMSYNELVDHIVANPLILTAPIIYHNQRILIGYEQEDVEDLAARIVGKRKRVEIND